MLTDSDREKMNQLVAGMHARTEAGKLDWERHTTPDQYIWQGHKGYVIVGEDRITVMKSFKDPPIIDQKNFPGADHLWALVHERWEQKANATIEAILRELDQLTPLPPPRDSGKYMSGKLVSDLEPPAPEVAKPPGELIPAKKPIGVTRDPVWEWLRTRDWQMVAIQATVVVAGLIFLIAGCDGSLE